MQQPAIQAALDNLVEVIRTAVMADLLEYFRGGDDAPVRKKRGKARAKAKVAKKARVAKKAKRS